MEKVSIIGNLYEELCDKVVAPESLKEKSDELYSKIVKKVKELTKDNDKFDDFIGLLDDFISALSDEFEYERKEVFKIGYDTCNSLRVEYNHLKVIIDGKDIELDNKTFEKLYYERVEEIAQINEVEKERDKAQIKSITFKELASKLSEEEIEKIGMAIEEYMESVYLNFGEYNKKYYYNGIKDSLSLTFVCSKK